MNRYQHECLLTARYLLRSSKLLFKNKFYGPSTSLAVLAIEECGKGFFLAIEPKPTEIKNGLSAYRIHQEKLDSAAFDLFYGGLMVKGFFNINKPITIKEYQKKIDRYLREGNKEFIDFAAKSFLIKKLNKIKKDGFYTDVQDGKIARPRDTKRKTAALVIEQAKLAVNIFPKVHGKKVN